MLRSLLEYYNVEESRKKRKSRSEYKGLRVPRSSGRGYACLYVGSFGKVRLVKKKNSNKYFCVKIMKKDELIKSQQVDHISNEYRILSTISHPFIVVSFLFRSTSRDSPRTPAISTSSWSTSPEENSSLTSGRKACSSPTRQRSSLPMQLLRGSYCHYFRVPAQQECRLSGSEARKHSYWS